MVQLYYGDGKGKTTAAVGAAVRAAGAGASVLFVSFYKDGSSCEVAADCFLVVLDEGADAFAGDLLPRQAVLDLLQRHGKKREIILTGHSLPADLAPLCDYVTRMTKERHPFDTGAPARRGIEY